MAKPTCESSLSISVFFLRKHGYFLPTEKKGVLTWSLRDHSLGSVSLTINAACTTLRCSPAPSGGARNQTVSLVQTPCYFGGTRFWFLCPECNRRVAIVYARQNDIGCRRCQSLSYRSSQATHVGNTGAMIRFMQLDAKLGEAYAEKRTKFWRKQATKKHRRWIAKRLELGRVTRSVAQAYQPR